MNRIALTLYDWMYGTIVIAVVFMAIASGILAMSLFKAAFKVDEMKAWRFLIFTLIFFALEEIFGTLKIFQIYVTPHITHVIPGFILATLIAALVNQIYINKGCV